MWNAATYELLGGSDARDESVVALTQLEQRIGAPLPAAVSEWYRTGGDGLLAGIIASIVGTSH